MLQNNAYEMEFPNDQEQPVDLSSQRDENLYSEPYEKETIYDSPLQLGVTASLSSNSVANTGRRTKRNEVYEKNDSDDGSRSDSIQRRSSNYSYAVNTDTISLLSSKTPSIFVYNNPVCSTEDENHHTYEESLARNSRFSQNIAYVANSEKAFTLENVSHNSKFATTKHSSFSNVDRKTRLNCIQIFTLMLSILACCIGIMAFLVASDYIELKSE